MTLKEIAELIAVTDEIELGLKAMKSRLRAVQQKLLAERELGTKEDPMPSFCVDSGVILDPVALAKGFKPVSVIKSEEELFKLLLARFAEPFEVLPELKREGDEPFTSLEVEDWEGVGIIIRNFMDDEHGSMPNDADWCNRFLLKVGEWLVQNTPSYVNLRLIHEEVIRHCLYGYLDGWPYPGWELSWSADEYTLFPRAEAVKPANMGRVLQGAELEKRKAELLKRTD